MLKLILIFSFTTFLYANSQNVALYLNSSKLKDKIFIGSASIISSDGYILTTYHNLIFDGIKDVEYLIKTDKYYRAKLITFDRDLDLALIKINKKNLNYFNISSDFKLGDRVFALGFSETKIHRDESNILSFEKLNEKLKVIKIDTKAKKGQSGGALIDENGNLIGIIFMKESDKVYAISAFSIKEFLSKNINLSKNYNFYYLFLIGVLIFAIILKRKSKSLILYNKKLKSSYKLNSNLNIGRDSLNEILLQERNVSKRHAIIEKIDGKFYIKDLNSTNGTFLNSKKLPPFKKFLIQNGDKIDFGLATLFEIKEG